MLRDSDLGGRHQFSLGCPNSRKTVGSGIGGDHIEGMTPVPLWNRSFVLWLIGSAQSRFAAALASIALSFLVLHQTGQAGQMAVTLACALIPNLVMPLAGAWVDRIGLKRPLIGANVVRGLLQLTVGGLALLSQQTGQDVPLWVINGAAFLTGLAAASRPRRRGRPCRPWWRPRIFPAPMA